MSVQYHEKAVESGASRAQGAALELFQIAALMLGDEEEAVSLVEEAFAGVQADPCADAGAAGEQARPRLVEIVLRRLVRLHPDAFALPPDTKDDATCIDTDDLSAAGMTSGQLAALLQGPGRGKMRQWLEHLPPALRAIFVLRAVAGQSGEQTLKDLQRSGAAGAEGWRREQVGTAYRQALCLLASSLVSSNAVLEPI